MQEIRTQMNGKEGEKEKMWKKVRGVDGNEVEVCQREEGGIETRSQGRFVQNVQRNEGSGFGK